MFFKTIFVSNHNYWKNPKRTRVIVSSMNMEFFSFFFDFWIVYFFTHIKTHHQYYSSKQWEQLLKYVHNVYIYIINVSHSHNQFVEKINSFKQNIYDEYVSDTTSARTCNLFRPKHAPNPLGHSDERTDSDIKLAYW